MPTGSIDILVQSQGQMIAPAGIWFEAANMIGMAVPDAPNNSVGYDPSFHEITYIWSIKDAPFPAYTAPENMVSGWNNANLAYGKKVALSFPTAGQYTVALWAIDENGITAEAERTVTIIDTDTAYPGVRTICYSQDPNETWAGEPNNCQRVTSVAALQSFLGTSSQPTRVLLKRGQVIDDLYLSLGVGQMTHLDCWGSGAQPVVRPPKNSAILRAFDSAIQTQITIANITFQGDWDSSTETGKPSISPLSFSRKDISCFYVINNCVFDGFATVSLATHATSANIMVVSNTTITNWRDYGVYVDRANNPDSYLAIIGSKVAQHADALNGGRKGGFHCTHGPIRYANMSNVYLSTLDLFSRTGWSSLGAHTADQPCLRANSLGEPNRTLTLDRVVAEGGWRNLYMGGKNGGSSGTSEHAGNYVLDKVLCIATAKGISPFIVSQYGGTTLRNVVGIVPDVPPFHSNTWRGCVIIDPDNPHINNAAAPLSIYSSSFINNRDPSQSSGTEWHLTEDSGAFDVLTLENNLLHAPEIETPVTSPGMDTTSGIPGITPRFKGVRYGFKDQRGSLNSNIASGGSFTIPYYEITTDCIGEEGTGVTDQAYWLAVPDTRHTIMTQNENGNMRNYATYDAEMSVAFTSSGVLITNLSTETWYGTYILRLDRHSLLAEFHTSFASPSVLPLPKHTVPSENSGAAHLGAHAYDDFLMTVRPGPGALDHTGTPRASTGHKPGAVFAD